MTDGQTVLDRRAKLAAMERGELPECRCGCPFRRHLTGAGLRCDCGCQRYDDTTEPEHPVNARLWSSPERQEARRLRRLAAHDAALDEITHGRKDADQ